MELIIVFSSFFLAAGISLFSRRRSVIESVSVVASSTAFISSVLIARIVIAKGPYTPFHILTVDALGAIAILIITLIGLVATTYSVAYLREETVKNIIGMSQVRQYYVLLNLFLAAMFFAVSSNNPVFTWISIEATTLSTAFLISFYNKPAAMEAAWKYLIINSIGLLLGFFGTLLFFTSMVGVKNTGFATWGTLLANAAHFDPTIAKIAFVFVVIGYGTKVGLVPMHTWLPDAHSKAPVPISALLSGVLLNVALIAIIRFKGIADASFGAAFSQQLLIAFGLLSIGVASLILFTQKNYKRMLAYSSIENMGIIAFGFGIGGLGIYAALLHMVYHSLLKSALFLMAGNVFLRYSTTKIAKVKGLVFSLPVTSILFLTGVFFIAGTPPGGIFYTKLFILTAGIQKHPAATIAAVLLIALLFIGLLKQVIAMVFGEKPEGIQTGEKENMLILAPLALIAIALYLSFHVPSFLKTLLIEAASHY